MKRYFKIIPFLLCLYAAPVFAQVGMTGNNPNKSAVLDLNATNKGLLIPRVNLLSVTDVTTITAPANNLLVYNTNNSLPEGTGFYYYNGSNWLKMIPIDNTGDNLGNHTATQYLNMQANKIYFNNADGIKVMLAGNANGPIIGLTTSTWTTAFQTGLQGTSGGEYVWSVYGGTGNNSLLERMRITAAGRLGIGTSTPTSMLEVAGNMQSDTGITVKVLPVASDSDQLVAINSASLMLKTAIKLGNLPSRSNYTVSAVASGATGVATILPWPVYKLIVTTNNTCGNPAVATFTVKNNVISCLGGQAYGGVYSVAEVGTTGNALKLTANIGTGCPADGSDLSQFNFTITVSSSSSITIQNNNTSVAQTYSLQLTTL